MRPSTIKYFLKEGLSGLKKNLLMTVASIVAVMACISIMSFSYCVASNLQHILQQMEDSIGISVFLGGNPTSQEIEEMKTKISKIDHVLDVQYISPGDALEALKKDWGADEDIFEGLDETNNPLSHSFQITLESIDNQGSVLAALKGIDGIDNIRHGQTETELIMKANKVFNIASILVMLILGVISVMIIMNTIRISVVNRRVEINIMKYVGATDWFIRWPFIIEGVIIGLVGAVIPLLIGMPIYAKVISSLYSYFPVIKMIQFLLTGDVFIVLFPVALVFGVLLGVIGSVTSIRKHLQV
ncbi:permease-like cell division protein FtsX [Anaerotignum propionicum]|uniref:Cell division protein FtsX n=1 Tax=Anaerotignum propionicum DSM 1682 TaxID=991789 RepID=A0A120MKG2_ANAPI|nr:permease-like cell division protein FtsX [Anaerotignum propionicum]AMJ42168.1 cell division protein FtsX [Anaerotignum propionicum DSM 1682]MEA5056910.1 permease-like cell division protein FtsX [Anaerotignum propionicum]SHE52953.1 cell division transport system permease protein [[Clostridium] propionicum DSM 1682] [Anaerotignum propionicum DSM 1682]